MLSNIMDSVVDIYAHIYCVVVLMCIYTCLNKVTCLFSNVSWFVVNFFCTYNIQGEPEKKDTETL